MNQIEVFEEIDAPPEIVWNVLLEFDRYPEWNPYIRSIEGEPIEGEHLRVRIDPPRSRAMTFEPEVVANEENRRLAWRGRLAVPFAFDGYHEFHLEPIDGGESSEPRRTSEDRRSSGRNRTRLLHRETFRGALVSLLFDQDSLEQGFTAMNRALKNRVEQRTLAAE